MRSRKILLVLFCDFWFCMLQQKLRRNPPEVRVTSGQKPSCKIIYIVLQTSVQLFEISSQKIHSWQHQNSGNECWTSFKTLERAVIWNETDEIFRVFAQVLWTLKFIFSRSHAQLISVLLQELIYVFSFKIM